MRYKVIMSSGEPITIEKDEVAKVMQAASRRALVVCKQGVINPSHMVSIVGAPDSYEGSNTPKAERLPEKPLADYFIQIRSQVPLLPGEKA